MLKVFSSYACLQLHFRMFGVHEADIGRLREYIEGA